MELDFLRALIERSLNLSVQAGSQGAAKLRGLEWNGF